MYVFQHLFQIPLLASNQLLVRLWHSQSEALITRLYHIHKRLDLIHNPSRSLPHSTRSQHTWQDLIHTRLDLIHARLVYCYVRLSEYRLISLFFSLVYNILFGRRNIVVLYISSEGCVFLSWTYWMCVLYCMWCLLLLQVGAMPGYTPAY